MTQDSINTKLETFFVQFEPRTYKKGQVIIRPEDTSGVFFLKQGNVREYGISPHGVEVGIHIFNPNSFFPMMWVIADIPNRYYYEALTDVQIYNAPKEKVLNFVKDNPEILFDLTKRILIGLDKVTSRIEIISYGKASIKVLSVLLYLSRHFGEEMDKKIYIKHKFTHQDIATLAGITRETTSREWEKLENEGIISTVNQTIIITDIEKLNEELQK